MTRKALLVGVDDYQGAHRLQGCANDVAQLLRVLRDVVGFQADDVRAVVNDRATKAAIEARLDWLVAGAKHGDLLVLHFSCLGSRIRSRDGDVLGMALDDVLCPHDMNWEDNFITDEYLRDRLQVPAGVVLEVIVDAGHAMGEERPAGDSRQRYLAPPIDIAARHAARDFPLTRLFARPMSPRVVLWAACGEAQNAREMRTASGPHGAFTYHFCQQLAENPALPRSELSSRLRASLAAAGGQASELVAPSSLLSVPAFQT
jgi:metacaspase-1